MMVMMATMVGDGDDENNDRADDNCHHNDFCCGSIWDGEPDHDS